MAAYTSQFSNTGIRRVFALCVVLLILISGAAHAQVLYRANLHVHTQVSNQLSFYDGLDGYIEFDHRFTQSPTATLSSAAAEGLKVVGLSDHGGSITSSEWIDLSTAVAANTTVTGLRGFEWTGSSHLNVFGTSSYADTARFGNGTPPYEIMTIPELYTWLKSASMADEYGSTPVVQFNHIKYGDMFDEFGHWDEQIDRLICLAELGSAQTPFYSQASHQEPRFQMALQAGWHVGPTIGIDNQTGVGDQAATRHTGVWVDSGSGSAGVMDALRERRVFASEDRDVSLQFHATNSTDGKSYWMGKTIPSDPKGTLFSLTVNDPSGYTKDAFESIDLMSSSSSQPVYRWGSTNATKNDIYREVYFTSNQLSSMVKTARDENCFYLRLKQKGVLGVGQDYIYSAPVWIKYWTPVSGTITTNTTWSPKNNPYLIKGLVSVVAGCTLTILPGTVVKFADSASKITVEGSISANGTAGSPIHFTSFKDDTVSGDTDHDTATPAAGDWSQINITGAGAQGYFGHCIVRYGGFGSSGPSASLVCSGGASLTVTNCSVISSNASGVYSNALGTTLNNNIIAYCSSSGIVLNGGSSSLTYSDTWQNGGDEILTSGTLTAGNIHLDPLFVSNVAGDFRLQAGSPCIDTGDPLIMDADGSRSDMGAASVMSPSSPASLELTINPGGGYLGALGGVVLHYSLSEVNTYSGTLVPDHSGKAWITGIQNGRYDLRMSSSHWLTRLIKNIDISQDTSLTVSLTNGDADGDNQINLFDFVVLDQHFGTSDSMADLDGSGQVNLFDYVIIDQNFGARGD